MTSTIAFFLAFCCLWYCAPGVLGQPGGGGAAGSAAGVFEQQIRSYCRGQRLGSLCDADVQKLCQIPQIAWICQRGGKGGGKGTGATPPPTAGPTPAGVTTTTARFMEATTSSPSVNRTRRPPRRKHTARPTQAPVTEKHQPTESPVSKKFVLNPEQIATIQANCAKKPTGCQGQSPKAAESKKHAQKALVQDLMKGKRASEAEATQKAQEILDAVQEAKRTMYDVQGLNGIEPDDDGLWNKDMRLNLEQAKWIQNEVSGLNAAPTRIAGRGQVKSGRDKRFSVFLESFPASKWNLPITYMIGSDLTADQGSQVRAAVAEIQRKTCITFVESSSTPNSPYILYQSYYSNDFCGQSPVGNQGGVNSVWLNFNCDSGNIKATIIHETMHSLGVHHEHVRVDRDDWITVDWSNIDPQSYDLFDGRPYVNSYTSYGVPYDYYSVMHYHAYVASLNGNANMIPKYFPNILTKKLGQRFGMSDRDAEKLRKMYCEPDCTDYHVWCGYWANKNYCLDTQYYDYMKSTCGKSCGFCPDAANA